MSACLQKANETFPGQHGKLLQINCTTREENFIHITYPAIKSSEKLNPGATSLRVL